MPGHACAFGKSNRPYTIIDFPGAVNTVATSISNSGVVTGYYQTSDRIASQHGFVYSNGQYTSIDPPAGIDPLAFSINNSGQVVGYYSDNPSTTDHGFVATDPPTTSTTDHGLDHTVALFSQSIAAGFLDENQHGALNTNPLSQVVMNHEQFLAHPHHG